MLFIQEFIQNHPDTWEQRLSEAPYALKIKRSPFADGRYVMFNYNMLESDNYNLIVAEARGLVLDNELDYWDKIVPIRLGDLYHGMELEQTLDICRIMRDETLSYDERLRKAYDLFMESGHSGMSAGLTASMIRRFCPDGADVADAVLDFRFEEHKKYD